MLSNKVICLCLGALLVCGTALVAEQMSDVKTPRVNFRLFDNYLVVVQGSLAGLTNKNLLIDTGTNPTIIDERVAEQLQLGRLTNMPDTLPAVTGSIKASFVVLPMLEFGPVRRESLTVAVEDLSLLRNKVGTRIDAVVGLDVLGKDSFRIDYTKHAIFFGRLPETASQVSFRTGPPFVTVPVSINHHQTTLLIDTGTSGVILFEKRLGTRDMGLTQLATAAASGLGGGMFLSAVNVTRAQMGNHELGVRRVYLTNRDSCCSFDGLMGISAELMKEIGFDFERRLFTWQLRDGAIPTMSDARSDGCLPALAPGLCSWGQASADVYGRKPRLLQ